MITGKSASTECMRRSACMRAVSDLQLCAMSRASRAAHKSANKSFKLKDATAKPNVPIGGDQMS